MTKFDDAIKDKRVRNHPLLAGFRKWEKEDDSKTDELTDIFSGGKTPYNKRSRDLQSMVAEAVMCVQDQFAQFDIPMQPQIRFINQRDTKYAKYEPTQVVEGKLEFTAEFLTITGVKRHATIPVTICDGEVIPPSTMVVNGRIGIISEHEVSEMLERVTSYKLPQLRHTFDPPLTAEQREMAVEVRNEVGWLPSTVTNKNYLQRKNNGKKAQDELAQLKQEVDQSFEVFNESPEHLVSVLSNADPYYFTELLPYTTAKFGEDSDSLRLFYNMMDETIQAEKGLTAQDNSSDELSSIREEVNSILVKYSDLTKENAFDAFEESNPVIKLWDSFVWDALDSNSYSNDLIEETSLLIESLMELNSNAYSLLTEFSPNPDFPAHDASKKKALSEFTAEDIQYNISNLSTLRSESFSNPQDKGNILSDTQSIIDSLPGAGSNFSGPLSLNLKEEVLKDFELEYGFSLWDIDPTTELTWPGRLGEMIEILMLSLENRLDGTVTASKKKASSLAPSAYRNVVELMEEAEKDMIDTFPRSYDHILRNYILQVVSVATKDQWIIPLINNGFCLNPYGTNVRTRKASSFKDLDRLKRAQDIEKEIDMEVTDEPVSVEEMQRFYKDTKTPIEVSDGVKFSGNSGNVIGTVVEFKPEGNLLIIKAKGMEYSVEVDSVDPLPSTFSKMYK